MKKYAPSIFRVLIIVAICHVAFSGEATPFFDYVLMAVLVTSLQLATALDE